MLNNNFLNGQDRPLSADDNLTSQERLSTDGADQIRKLYCKPQLEEFGDLRALTFGSFLGGNDSDPPTTSFDSGIPLP